MSKMNSKTSKAAAPKKAAKAAIKKAAATVKKATAKPASGTISKKVAAAKTTAKKTIATVKKKVVAKEASAKKAATKAVKKVTAKVKKAVTPKKTGASQESLGGAVLGLITKTIVKPALTAVYGENSPEVKKITKKKK